MNLKKQFNGIQHIGIPTNDIVHFLPFWENGVKFFTIEGPNKEKVEFSQYLLSQAVKFSEKKHLSKQVLFVFNLLLRKA